MKDKKIVFDSQEELEKYMRQHNGNTSQKLARMLDVIQIFLKPGL